MKNAIISFTVCLAICSTNAVAQRGKIQYFRPYDKSGLNVFETTKEDTIGFAEFQLRLGANFTQGFQTLKHENQSGVALYPLYSGFPLAQANLNIDAQLVDGVRVSLVSYMASHHHNEFWVKGGYFQIDKVGFLNSETMNNIWKNLTLKIGHMEINYGDAHFRRSDGGNNLWNPFIENNIMDAFTTEIGAEVYWQRDGIILMGGLSNGEIQGSVTAGDRRGPSVYGKLGYDKVLADRTRVRITASLLTKSSSVNGTLYGGDRTGSNYQFVMEPANATVTGNAFSGRYNPNFRDNVTAMMINPFIKFQGLEFFGTLEFSEGNSAVENGEIQYTSPIITPNIMLKGEWVTQKYKDFPAGNIMEGGKFEGFVVQGSIGF